MHAPVFLLLQDRGSNSNSLPIRISLFLIQSYSARLIIGIIAIAWIMVGAAINMSTCDSPQEVHGGVSHSVCMYILDH